MASVCYLSELDVLLDALIIASDDVMKFRKLGVQLDSEELKEWWAEVEASSCLPIQTLETWDDWRYLMEILTQFDVSRIEKLYLGLPDTLPTSEGQIIPKEYQFGHVIFTRGSGFSALKTLAIYCERPEFFPWLGTDSLANALRSGVLRNLRSLLFSPSPCPPEILEELTERDVPHLTSLVVRVKDLNLDAAFQSPCFNKLRLLALIDPDPNGWQSFIRGIQARNLSNLTDFVLSKWGGFPQNLEDIAKWFSSLKSFTMCNSSMSFVLCDLLDAVMKAPITELALKTLSLKDNFLDYTSVDALVHVADSGRLPHLETLDVRHNVRMSSKSLVTLIQSIQRGSLPSLQRLEWKGNKVDDADVEAVVEAYFENKSLTTHIEIDWERVSDPSLRTKLETYRDRNEKLVKLLGEEKLGQEKQVEELGDLMPLTSARVFICGYPEVGKTTLRKTLLRHFAEGEKSAEGENVPEVRKSSEVESGPKVRPIPDVESGPKVRQNPDVERSPEVVKTTARKPLIHCFGKWCSCLGTTLPNEQRSLPNEDRSLPNEERSLPNEEPTLLNEETGLPNQEPRTRGIEVSRIEDSSYGERTTLVLWDLAGQEEYHVLHSAFLADRGFISGKVTTFILVFKASYEPRVEGKLLYWLGMVASSSSPSVKRHVMIVLNRFEGEAFDEDIHEMPWRELIEGFVKLFGELDICVEPFFVDVRKPADVQRLRDHLFNKARDLLKGLKVPKIFFDLQMELKGWSEREENKGLPILTWEAFQKSWVLKPTENRFSVEALERGASILHEIGEIIYLKETDPDQRKDPGKEKHLKRSIVVPNPEWFCRKIVGELLLPEKMFEGDTALKILFDADGSIPIARFQSYFKKLLVGGTKIDDLVSMLEHVGLCYRKSGEKKLIAPALIRKDDYSTIGWRGQGTEVMGRCFTIKDPERNNADQEQKHDGDERKYEEGRKYFIPAALFRRLQVELAHDERFGGRGDSDYRVGKSFLSFNVGPLFVLVQFDVDPSDPIDDRIDILVEIRKDSTDMKLKPVECICEIMQKLERLCVDICPGLKYQINVIEPASVNEGDSASNRIEQMSGRNLMALKEIKDLTIKGEEYLNWKTVGGDYVQPESCLSVSELQTVVNTIKAKYFECQNDQKAMEIRTLEASDEGRSSNGAAGDKSLTSGSNDQEPFAKQADRIIGVVCKQADRIIGHIDKKITELKSELVEFRQKHDRLVKEIQAQQLLFIADKVSNVPRYIFLSKKRRQSWISVTEAYGDAFSSTYQLHFLCEGHVDHRLMHEVEGQEGIELQNPRDWLVKASPWLRWSLQVAVMVGKTVGNVYLPGVFSLIPDINLLDSNSLAKAVDRAAPQILAEGRDANQVRDGDRDYGAAHQPVKLDDKAIAESVVKDLKRELGDAEFADKTRLRRMRFREPHVVTSNQAQSPVVWICKDCIEKYEDKVTPFSS